VLTPNLKGFEAAVLSKPDEIVVFGAASEAFSQKNINCSIAESIERFAPVVAAAREAGIYVRGAMSCTVGCPYEGDIAPERVSYLAGLMHDIGVQHVGVADTIGVGTPVKVQRAMEATLKHYDINDVSGHFHDTYGQALANTLACLQMGVWQFDTSVAGLGGCPYAKGATGNVASEDVVYMLHGMGIETGIDLEKLIDAGQFISDFLGRATNSRAAKALFTKRQS
jgi:hydroxymethylglutaryl-CoA lyase